MPAVAPVTTATRPLRSASSGPAGSDDGKGGASGWVTRLILPRTCPRADRPGTKAPAAAARNPESQRPKPQDSAPEHTAGHTSEHTSEQTEPGTRDRVRTR